MGRSVYLVLGLAAAGLAALGIAASAAVHLVAPALMEVPAFLVTALTISAVIVAAAFLTFGGLSRHRVLVAANTLFRVCNDAYRQELLATTA